VHSHTLVPETAALPHTAKLPKIHGVLRDLRDLRDFAGFQGILQDPAGTYGILQDSI
jgi:hypothetical protein